MSDVYPDEPATWTAENPPPAVRIAGSHRVHAASVMAGRVIFPACGVSLGRAVTRVPVADATAIDCPSCRRVRPAITVPEARS